MLIHDDIRNSTVYLVTKHRRDGGKNERRAFKTKMGLSFGEKKLASIGGIDELRSLHKSKIQKTS